MSVQPQTEAQVGIPEWTLTDRLRKAREHAGYTQTQLAETTGISRASIQNYESGKTKPARPVLLSWAFACGVSNNWLCHGDSQPCLGGPGEGVSAGHRGVMIPCSSPPAILAFTRKLPARTGIYHRPIELPAAA